MNSTNNEIYNIFGGHGFSATLAIIFGIKAFLASCGIASNGSLVLVTFFNKSLHKPCNILIAINAFCASMAMLNPLITLPIVISGLNFIPLGHCVYWQLFPMGASVLQFLLFLLIAIDRMIAVLYPIWYMQGKTKNFLIISVTGCSVYVLYHLYVDYVYSMENANKLVICTAPDIIDVRQYWQSIMINILSIACYIILWLAMLHKHKALNSFTRRILLSISVSFLVEFFGWLSNNVLRSVLISFNLGQLKFWYISQFAGYFLLAILSLYAPVFYVFSSEYRQAFYRTFNINKSSTTTVQVITVPNRAWTGTVNG